MIISPLIQPNGPWVTFSISTKVAMAWSQVWFYKGARWVGRPTLHTLHSAAGFWYFSFSYNMTYTLKEMMLNWNVEIILYHSHETQTQKQICTKPWRWDSRGKEWKKSKWLQGDRNWSVLPVSCYTTPDFNLIQLVIEAPMMLQSTNWWEPF